MSSSIFRPIRFAMMPSLLVSALCAANAAYSAPVVNGQTISWPDDGWYQVQAADTYQQICGGGRSCDVEPGTYIVINHSTGERFSNINVSGGSGGAEPEPPVTAVTVNGQTISWPDDGWYQVQTADTYQHICEGGRSCDVEPGTYVVINHSTGERFDNIKVVATPGTGGDDALLSLERASSLLQKLTALMRRNGLTEHQSTLRFLNSIDEDHFISEEVLESRFGENYYSFNTLYRRECVNGGSVEHRVEHGYHSYYRHGFYMDDCRIPGYRFVSGFGLYSNQYDGFVYIGNTWTGDHGMFDALVVEQGDVLEIMTATLIQDNTSQGQIGSSDRYNVRRYLNIENGEYDYKQGEVEVVVRDWNHRFNRFDPVTGQHAFNRLKTSFTVNASWTDGQTLDIDAVFDGRGEEAPWFDSGRLRIVSDTGDSLEVLAGTGDPETYQLVSTVNGVTVSEIRRWDVNGCELVNTYWQEDLDREQCMLMPPLG